MTKIVVDTNVWIHCRFFRDLPWVEFIGDDTEILIPPVLLRELDKLKNGPRTPKSERARKVLRELEQIFRHTQTAVPVSAGLTMTALTREPHFPDGLDRDVADDRFLATILAYEEPRPVFISNDLGARIKAKSMGLAVRQPPDDWLMPEEPDEIQQLKREIEAMKAASPRPVVTFFESKTHQELTLRSVAAPSDILLLRYLGEIRRKHPLVDEMSMKRHYRSEQFNQSLRAFYEEYEEYLKGLADSVNAQQLCAPVALALMNEGSAPADDIDVHITVSVGVPVDRRPRKTSPPEVPVLGAARPIVDRFADLSLLEKPFTPVEKPNVRGPRLVSSEVRYQIGRLKHGMLLKLPPFYVRFDKFEEVRGVRIDYSVHAANVRKHVEGQLNLVLKTETVSFDEFFAEKAAATKRARHAEDPVP